MSKQNWYKLFWLYRTLRHRDIDLTCIFNAQELALIRHVLSCNGDDLQRIRTIAWYKMRCR
jgi:hypothetical protein